MLTLIVSVILASLPAAYELDYRALPAANTVKGYEFTVVLSFKGEPDVKILCGVGMRLGPDGAADGLMRSLSDSSWKIKRDGERITIYGYDDVLVTNVAVKGDGPKPLVSRVLIPPEKKK